MRLTWKDGIATTATAAAVVFYALWATDTVAPNLSVRVATLVVFGLGFIGCPTAARDVSAEGTGAPRWYATTATVLGFVALVAGVSALAFGNGTMLAILVVAMVALWLAATVRHALGSRPYRRTGSGGRPLDSAARGPHPTF
jgi:hypothetical protein